MKTTTTVIHHDADFDGIFCREIAKYFLPGATLVGWDFGRPKLEFPDSDYVYVLDLPYLEIFTKLPDDLLARNFLLIDHHKTSIAGTPRFMRRYCVDGVAACRLAWQFFAGPSVFPTDPEQYRQRRVGEPYAVTLAGEYDVWDHSVSGGVDIDFQYGLTIEGEDLKWNKLLWPGTFSDYIKRILDQGSHARRYNENLSAELANKKGFDLDWEGMKFRVINHPKAGSLFFEEALRPEHDACLSFYYNGSKWIVSMYGVPTKLDVDLTPIAKKYGGGGHKQACGFQTAHLPWL